MSFPGGYSRKGWTFPSAEKQIARSAAWQLVLGRDGGI